DRDLLDSLAAVTFVGGDRTCSLLRHEGRPVPFDDITTTLSWPERIENYRREIGIPYLGHENGWTYGTWLIGNSYQKKTTYCGGCQGNFLKRIAALFPDRKRVLHLFAGQVDLAAFPGDTLDIAGEDLAPTTAAMPRPVTACRYASATSCWRIRRTARAMPG